MAEEESKLSAELDSISIPTQATEVMSATSAVCSTAATSSAVVVTPTGVPTVPTQLLRIPVNQLNNRLPVTNSAGSNVVRPVRALPPGVTVRLISSADASLQGAGNVQQATRILSPAGALGVGGGKTSYVLCQVSGGKAVLMPQSVNAARLTAATNSATVNVVKASQSASVPSGSGVVQLSAGSTQLQILRTPLKLATTMNSGATTRLQIVQTSTPLAVPPSVAVGSAASHIQLVQLAPADGNGTLSTNVALASAPSGVNNVRMVVRPPSGLRLLSPAPTSSAITAGGNAARLVQPQRMTLSIPASSGGVLGTGGAIRLIQLRGGTPLSVNVSGSSSSASAPGSVSHIRLVAAPAGVSIAGQASLAGKLPIPASGSAVVSNSTLGLTAQVKQTPEVKSVAVIKPEQSTKPAVELLASKTSQSVVVVQHGTPLLLQSASPGIRATASSSQLATMLKSSTGITVGGKTYYMLADGTGGGGQTLAAALAQNKVPSSVGLVSSTPGVQRVIAIPSVGMQAVRPGLSSAIIVDARQGGTLLSKADQHQAKASRIVAEAIAKAQAEGINLDDFASDSDSKKRRRKRNADGDMFDTDFDGSGKRKRLIKQRTPGRRGGKFGDMGDEELITDMNADGLAISEECEVATVETFEGSGLKMDKFKSKMKKKRRPLATFLKNKSRRRKKDSESDMSDSDMGSQGMIDDETLQLLQTRRSGRVTKRKKYTDDLDLDLSEGENSNDGESTVAVETDNYVNGITLDQNQQADIFVENPADEDAQLVDKILAMRVVRKKVVNQRIVSADDNADVDIEGNDDRRDVNRKSICDENVEEVEVEEFFVKYKNYSYLHCEWRTADELLIGDKRVLSKIKRFKLKKMQNPFSLENEEDEPFNPEYVEVDRILDVAVSPDEATGEQVTHYLVLWRSLPYEDSTWELEQDIDQEKVEFFYKYRKLPTKEERQFKQRPYPVNWKTLDESPVYKNDNVLRDYQLEGLNWLTFSYYNRQNCILADEMGLGKTIQSITFLNEVFKYGIRGPFLVVVPLSTLGNWQREFEAWTDLNAIVYHGSAASRNMLKQYEMYYRDELGNRIYGIYKFHVLITTYEVIITDLEELSQIDWRVTIIDEAHRLKNRNCKLLQGLTCFEMEHRVLLTGTPLQNNVDELFSLLSFLEPRQFSSSEAFMAEFGRLETESQVEKLKALLKPMMLRRLKEDVEKTLASKEETIVEVELTNIQKKYYRAILERNFTFLAKGGSSTNLPNLMNTMMELRKCCNHPYLVNGAEEQILEEAKGTSGSVIDAEKLFQVMVQSSGKLVLVDKLLPKLRADGHKVLIFSQMIRVLDIIEDYLIHRHYLYERIDGRIRGNLRQEAIDRFCKPDSDRFVFLLCTRAGGLGINLTAADTVIIFDSDWNPQNDIQAQARCHRIGQMKAVKVYRLITRNTYEREMFDKASLKLGLDKAVLQSMGNKEMNVQNQLSKKDIEDLLKRGAYGALMDNDQAGDQFCEEDIEHILRQRTQVIQIAGGTKGSTFSKASFNLSNNRTDINVDDPNFWQKWAKKADIDVSGKKSELIMDIPRQRKVTSRYGRHEMVEMSDLDSSNSEGDENGSRKKCKKRRQRADDEPRGSITYTRSECFKVEKNLLVYGWGRWDDIMQHCSFKRKLRIEDVITITRAMLLFSLKHYEGDDRIKKFILDLISPLEDGKERDYKNHSGLSAPVPRGRKGRKIKKDSLKKEQFDEDLSKLDIDVDKILVDDSYKKHLVRQSNKVLLRVRLLYYLKQEIIGRQADKIFAGAPASEIDVPPIVAADVDIPIHWWDVEADRSLLIGVFKHGYEKYNQMRSDPSLCFLSRCGPPDDKALLAEQNDEDDMKELDDEEVQAEADDDSTPRRGRRKKKKKASKSKQDGAADDDVDCSSVKSSSALNSSQNDNGKLPFPSASDLNTRFRRVITSFQRCHKQGMLKLEQISKKMYKREQLMERDQGSDGDDSPPSPSRLPSLGFEGINSNPLLLAEQLHWTRREETEFYRVVSTFGVERDCETGQFIWDKFRTLAKLERKLDNTLTEYFRAFYHMCLKVCHRFSSEEEARPPNGLIVLPITEERANRCLARIDLLNKIREQILWHPMLDKHLALCQPSSYLPAWWICGQHDKDLLIGAAKHGVSHTEINILNDPMLSFLAAYQQYQERMAKEVKDTLPESQSASSAVSTGNGSSGSQLSDVVSQMGQSVTDLPTEQRVKTKLEVNKTEESEEIPEFKPPSIFSAAQSQQNPSNGGNVSFSETLPGSKDKVKSEEINVKEEEGLDNDETGDGKSSFGMYWNYQWPKDRLIFYRLEHLCHCVETGRWRMSHRHLQTYESGTPTASLPGTPVVGCSDYSIVPNADDVGDGLKMVLHKRRHRRTKAEIELERSMKWREMSGECDSSGMTGGDDSCTGEIQSAEGNDTPPFVRRKSYGYRSKHSDEVGFDRNQILDPDSRIPVASIDGQHILSGEDAPALRDLEAWLEEHPNYAPVSSLMGSGQSMVPNLHRSGRLRRPRVDPTKLALDQLTGDENVTVVNRNTGKRITGTKAPALRDLNDWLARNPGFDIDAKWSYVLLQLWKMPGEYRQKFALPAAEVLQTSCQQHSTSSSCGGIVDPSHDYGLSTASAVDSRHRSSAYQSSNVAGYSMHGQTPFQKRQNTRYKENVSYDYDDEDTNSDREVGCRESATLSSLNRAPTSSGSSSLFGSSQPYLCSPSVVDRMFVNMGGTPSSSSSSATRTGHAQQPSAHYAIGDREEIACEFGSFIDHDGMMAGGRGPEEAFSEEVVETPCPNDDDDYEEYEEDDET